MATRVPYAGPALPSLGLRRFFLSAALFAAAAIVTSMLVLAAEITLIGPFAPVDRHIHEMLFGYAGAVIVGFLFTAIAKWTGRMPARGAPLAMLPALWIAGRLAVAGVFGLGPVAVMVIDLTCLAAISEMIVREVVAGRNWRNLKVVVPALLFTMANAAFHFEAMTVGAGDAARRLGFAASCS